MLHGAFCMLHVACWMLQVAERFWVDVADEDVLHHLIEVSMSHVACRMSHVAQVSIDGEMICEVHREERMYDTP